MTLKLPACNIFQPSFISILLEKLDSLISLEMFHDRGLCETAVSCELPSSYIKDQPFATIRLQNFIRCLFKSNPSIERLAYSSHRCLKFLKFKKKCLTDNRYKVSLEIC